MLSQIGTAFLQVTLLSFVLTAVLLHIAKRKKWLDKDPHQIQESQKKVASYGGIAIFLSFWIGSIFTIPQLLSSSNQFWLFIASIVILIVGIIDDTIELNPIQKTIGILLAANLLYFKAGIEFSSALLPEASPLFFEILSYSATIIWIYAVTNAVNLIDGVDGLACSVSIVSLITLIITTYFFSLSIRMAFLTMLILLTGAILGFLPFNWVPARIYLGDTGALFIGFMYAALSVSNLKNASLFSLIVPVLIYMVPLFDASYAMMRRFLTNKPIGQADREHLHHRLLRFGFSKRQVVLSMICITIIFSLIAIFSHIWPNYRVIWLIVTGVILIILMVTMNKLSKQNK
ncbi:MraY family glycosyltransferase [Globicatella sulfidifaciens]